MKKLISVMLACALAMSLCIPAFAAGGSPKIIDNAGLLSSSEEDRLEDMAEDLADEYDMDVVILIEESIWPNDITAYADDYFDNNGYGIGSEYSGALLLLDMDTREWTISTCGNAIDALTDYGQEKIMDDVLDYLSDGEYYDGFYAYLELLDDYFEAYEKGDPIDISSNGDEPSIVAIVIAAIFFGLVVGGITVLVMRSKMKTVKPQRGAQSYVRQGSFNLTKQKDTFLYTNTTRTRKESSSSSSSSRGGSSTHRSSSGRSHGGSRGRF